MTWVSQAAMPNARSRAKVQVIGTHIYSLGGSPQVNMPGGDPAIFVDNPTVQSFDTSTNTWTQRASIPWDVLGRVITPSGFFSGGTYANVWQTTVINGCVHTFSADAPIFESAISPHWRYNPGNNAWEQRAQYPNMAGSMPGTMLPFDHRMAALGSYHAAYGAPETFDRTASFVLNDATNTWTQIGSISTASGAIKRRQQNSNQWWYADNRGVTGYFVTYYAHYFDISNNSYTSTETVSPFTYISMNHLHWFPSRARYLQPTMGDSAQVFTDVFAATAAGGRKTVPMTATDYMAAGVGEFMYFFGGYLGDPPVYQGTHWRYSPDMPVPTAVTPVLSAVVNSDLVTFTANVTASGGYAILEWQIARDTGFTTDPRVYSEDPAWSQYGAQSTAYKLSGLGSYVTGAGAGSELYQGTWHRRARQKNGVDEYSPWTTTQAFSVSHPPAGATVSPSGDQTLDYQTSGDATFTWTFSDSSPTDFQSAWQIVCERNDTGALIFDTGKVASQNQRSYAYNFAAAQKDVQLRWKIRVWDSDDITGGYSNYALFRISDKPTVNITAPAQGGTTGSSSPTVTWTFVASGGRAQAAYRVRFFQSGATIHDTGVVPGNATSYTPDTAILSSGGFVVQVDSTDNRGLVGTDSNGFSVNFVPPARPTDFILDASMYEPEGYIEIQWNNQTKDPSWVAWRIYRRLSGADVAPSFVYETMVDQSTYTHRDYTAGSNVTYEYFIVQVANRGGAPAESNKDNGKLIQGTSSKYWLIHKTDPTKNILLHHVSDEDFTDEYETNTMTLIGRGRKTDIGTYLGYAGTLSAQLADKASGPTAREQRMELEQLKKRRESIFLRTPFGDVFLVNVGNLQFKRVPGVALHEMLAVTIPYEEIR